jgi:hypothetical protein
MMFVKCLSNMTLGSMTLTSRFQRSPAAGRKPILMSSEARDDVPLSGPHIATEFRNILFAFLMCLANALAHLLTARLTLWRKLFLMLPQAFGHATATPVDAGTILLDIYLAGPFSRGGNCSLTQQRACN